MVGLVVPSVSCWLECQENVTSESGRCRTGERASESKHDDDDQQPHISESVLPPYSIGNVNTCVSK